MAALWCKVVVGGSPVHVKACDGLPRCLPQQVSLSQASLIQCLSNQTTNTILCDATYNPPHMAMFDFNLF